MKIVLMELVFYTTMEIKKENDTLTKLEGEKNGEFKRNLTGL